MCIILVVVATIATPIIEKKIEKEEAKRLKIALEDKPAHEKIKQEQINLVQNSMMGDYIPIYVPQYYDATNMKNGKPIVPAVQMQPPFSMPSQSNDSDKKGGEK